MTLKTHLRAFKAYIHILQAKKTRQSRRAKKYFYLVILEVCALRGTESIHSFLHAIRRFRIAIIET